MIADAIHKHAIDILQVRQKTSFFSLFYMSINVGSLLSTIITPLIRGEPFLAYFSFLRWFLNVEL